MITPRQAEAARLFKETGNKAEVARLMGNIDETSVRDLLERHDRNIKKLQDLDPAIKAAMGVVGTGMVPTGMWVKTKPQGDEPGYSLYLRPEAADNDPERILAALREGLSGLRPEPVTPVPDAPESLCAVFPVADLHLGMLADKEEVGTDWDTKIARRVFDDTFARLVSVTPAAGVAILAQLGDLMHIDDQRNVTPQHKHQLDADSRYFLTLRRAVSAMKGAIETLRRRYPKVIYRGCRGNHDITAHYAVTLALSEFYRDTPEVEIVDNAGEFYVHEFGVNMTLIHHGDKAKPERLIHFMAAEWPQVWGRTVHRKVISGHLHHEVVKEVGGATFETVGTIIPRDAHAYGNAYSAKRALVSITLDAAQGEVSRARVNL